MASLYISSSYLNRFDLMMYINLITKHAGDNRNHIVHQYNDISTEISSIHCLLVGNGSELIDVKLVAVGNKPELEKLTSIYYEQTEIKQLPFIERYRENEDDKEIYLATVSNYEQFASIIYTHPSDNILRNALMDIYPMHKEN